LADVFFDYLKKKLTKTSLLNIGYCFLSEETGIEKTLLHYIRLLLKQGEKVNDLLVDPAIFRIRHTCEKVDYEVLRMQGFIRFRKLRNQVYYGPIAPDHNVIQLLAPHFKARFADQRWLIHDTRRKTGIYYNGAQVRFLPWVEMSAAVQSVMKPFQAEQESVLLDKEELKYQQIWDQYFQKVAITERRNKRQQRQRMPERYWRYLVENVAEY
jgi:probable DNA metabolism protein